MSRIVALCLITLALALPACSPAPEPEVTPVVVVAPPVIPPPPPAFVDVLPEFKRNSRLFLDMAKKLHESAAVDPPPPYPAFWKDCEVLEEVYSNVINNEPKTGPGASTFDRINKIRDSLFQTRLHLKNKDTLKLSQVAQLLETEADKRKPFFDEAEFFWKQTPDKTKKE